MAPTQTMLQSASAERIGVGVAGAILVAGVILVAAVLPAEFGVDPLGTGKRLGLSGIAAAAEPDATTAAAAPAQELEPTRPGANTPQPSGFKRDVIKLSLGPYEGVEYKYQMEKGGSMVYTWTSTGKVRYDFHGEPAGAPPDYAESYEMSEGQAAQGSFFAPSSGIHGWFWENLSTDDITITLTSAGFYSSGIEMRPDGRTVHQVAEP
jgi:hypothetical protein